MTIQEIKVYEALGLLKKYRVQVYHHRAQTYINITSEVQTMEENSSMLDTPDIIKHDEYIWAPNTSEACSYIYNKYNVENFIDYGVRSFLVAAGVKGIFPLTTVYDD